METETKAACRTHMKAWLQSLSPEILQEAAQVVADYLIKHPLWMNSHCVSLYIPLSYELSTKLLLKNAWENGKIIVLPRISGQTLTLHKIDDKKHLLPGPYQ